MPSSFRFLFAIALILSSAAVPPLHAEETLGWQALPGIFRADRLAKFDALKKLPAPPAESAFFHPGDDLRDLSEFFDETAPHCWNWYHNPEPPPPNVLHWPGRWAVWNATTRTVVARGAWDDLLYAEKELLELGSYLPDSSFERQLTVVLSYPGTGEQRRVSMRIAGETTGRANLDGMTIEASCRYCDEAAAIPFTCSWQDDEAQWKIESTPSIPLRQAVKVAGGGLDHPWELTLECKPVLTGSAEDAANFHLMEKDGTIVIRTSGDPWPVWERLGEHRVLAITTSSGLTTCGSEPSNWWGAPVLGEIPPELAGRIGPGLLDLRGCMDKVLDLPEGSFKAQPGFFAAYDPRSTRYFFVADEAMLDRHGRLPWLSHWPSQARLEASDGSFHWNLLTGYDGIAELTRNDRHFKICLQQEYGPGAGALSYETDRTLSDGSHEYSEARGNMPGWSQPHEFTTDDGRKVTVTASKARDE